MASTCSGQWPLSQGFRCCHSVQNGRYAGIRVSQAPIQRMSSKYASLKWLALSLVNGHCHSTWGEKQLKHEFQKGMLPAPHCFCPMHAHHLPKLQHVLVLIFVRRIVATVTATRNDQTLIHFSRKLFEGFLVKKRLPCTHHYTYSAHLHTTTLTPLTYTAPQHLHTSRYTYTAHLHCATAFAHIALHLHRSPTLRHSICTHRTTCTAHVHCAHHYTYTAHLHCVTAFAHITFTSPSFFSFFLPG